MAEANSVENPITYFLINNNYQYFEAVRLASEIRATGRLTGLIAVPHTFSVDIDRKIFNPVISIPTPIRLSWPNAWVRYFKARKLLRTVIPASAGDMLLLFTEFELLNHLVALVFKERRGSTLLIEDGGVGSYIPLSLRNPERYSLKDWIRQITIRAIPGLGGTQFTKFDGQLFPMLEDKHLISLLLYRRMRINRNIPVNVITRPSMKRVEKETGRVVFLNQPLYSEHIQSPIDYADGLKKILSALCSGYSEVFFKFHPREHLNERSRIAKNILDLFPTVKIIEGDEPFEKLISHLRPEAVASYNSTPLLNLTGTGVQPLFLYHLLPDLRKSPSFIAMHTLLIGWGYKFVADWNEIATGYCAEIDFCNDKSARPIADVLKQFDPN